MLLDRSGSMINIREATVAGINEFIVKQQSTPGEATLKLIQFDDYPRDLSYNCTLDGNLKEINPLELSQFVPRGGTPLYDAVGKAIDELGVELNSLSENERPGKVVFCIITDGYENASKKFSSEQIKEKVEHQTNKYNWQFTYIGANQDAILVGNTLGIDAIKCMSYSADSDHTVNAFSGVSGMTTRLRNTKDLASLRSISYTKGERDSSLKEEDHA